MVLSEYGFFAFVIILQLFVFLVVVCYLLIGCFSQTEACDICGRNGPAYPGVAAAMPRPTLSTIAMQQQQQHGHQPDLFAQREMRRQQMIEQMMQWRHHGHETRSSIPTTYTDLFERMNAEDRASFVDNCLRIEIYELDDDPSSHGVRACESPKTVDERMGACADEGTCSICQDVIEAGEKVSRSHHPSCEHMFHTACVRTWLLQHVDCPLCRRNFLEIPDEIAENMTEDTRLGL